MSHEAEIEQMIQAKGMTRPRLTPQQIDDTIQSESYTKLPSGKVMVCELAADCTAFDAVPWGQIAAIYRLSSHA